MDGKTMTHVTCLAPVNIAIIKYWGKRDEKLILPLNDSLSMTLSTEKLAAKTTVCASPDFPRHRMWLNDVEQEFEQNERLMSCLNAIHRLVETTGTADGRNDGSNDGSAAAPPITWKLHICSRNNFATAAGLASSAAGYACLVFALAQLYGVADRELTAIARLGSGSACRSLHGGFVRWHRGQLDDGSDSIATQMAAVEHWPDMHVLILVVSEQRKNVSSTSGMQRSVLTSQLLKHRIEHCVANRIASLSDAIHRRDFAEFAEIVMRDSNQFHAIALDTYPPCVYMNDVSHAICNFVHAYNAAVGSLQVAYSFDAGANAFLFVLAENVPLVMQALKRSFPDDDEQHFTSSNTIPCGYTIGDTKPAPSAGAFIEFTVPASRSSPNAGDEQNGQTTAAATFLLPAYRPHLIKQIIHTKIGGGPKRLPTESNECLIDTTNGLPLAGC